MYLQIDYFSQYHTTTKVVPNIVSCMAHVEVAGHRNLSVLKSTIFLNMNCKV